MYKSLLLLAYFFSAFTVLSAQDIELAEFGNNSITAEEFIKRFELTPRVRSSANIDSQKTHFLFTLVAEKLWAKEAREQNLDTLYSYKQYIENLEKMLVRDALFKREITSKIEISPAEVQNALEKQKYELQFKFLFSKSKSEIDSLYNELRTTHIDSLLKNRFELQEQTDPVKVVFGQMEPELEDSLFNLSVGEFTKPIFNEIGWVIYYLVDKNKLGATELGAEQSLRSEATTILVNREKQKLMHEYLRNLFTDLDIKTDGELFNFLSAKLLEVLLKKEVDENQKLYYLYENDIIKIINNLPEQLAGNKFIKFSTDPVSLKEFLYYLYFNNFKSAGLNKIAVQNSLKQSIDEFIRNEVVAREGYQRQLHLLPEIQNELAMWKDNFLAQYLRNTYNNSAKVTESELEEYITEKSNEKVATKLVSITEVRLSGLDEAQNIFSQIQFGNTFNEALSAMQIPETRISRSDSLVPIYTYPELAEIIDQMKEGEVYGPVVRAAGYSIIKLNEIEEKTLSPEEQNQLQISNNREILFYKKLEKILTDKTVDFAEKYNLEVRSDLLNEIKVTEIPTLIYRYYGFGGQTVAAPFLNLFYDWYYQYKDEKTDAL